MTLHQNFAGIDISKAVLDVFDDASHKLKRIPNTADAIANLLEQFAPDTIVVFEATGHYDRTLRLALDQSAVPYVRVNPTRARDFAKAAGYLAKTDAIDAKMLAAMGRAMGSHLTAPVDPVCERLAVLNSRRDQLVDIRSNERKRILQTHDASVREGIERHILWLNAEMSALARQIASVIQASADLSARRKIMQTAPGIGTVTATVLLAQMPELGTRTPKTIAALAGLAPLNNDSGARRGKRTIKGGRRRVRQALYMAALSAIRKVPRFANTYRAIALRAGSAKVALIAIARKLLVAINAMIRQMQPFEI